MDVGVSVVVRVVVGLSGGVGGSVKVASWCNKRVMSTCLRHATRDRDRKNNEDTVVGKMRLPCCGVVQQVSVLYTIQ